MSKYIKRADGGRDYKISTSYSTLTDRELSLKLRSESWSQLDKSERLEVFQEMENRNAAATGRPAAKVVSCGGKDTYGYYTAANNKIHVNVKDSADNNSYQMLHTYYHERQHSVQAYDSDRMDPQTASMSKVEDLNKNYNGTFNSSVELTDRQHYDMLTCEMDSNNVATQNVLKDRELYRTDPEYQKFLTEQYNHFEKVNDTNQILRHERYERQKEMVNNSSNAHFSSSKITAEQKEQLTSSINQMQYDRLDEPVVTESLRTEYDVKAELNAVQLQSKSASSKADVKDQTTQASTTTKQEQGSKAKAQSPSNAYNKGSSFWTNVKVASAVTTYRAQSWLAEKAVSNGYQTISGYCISKGLNAGVGAIATSSMGTASGASGIANVLADEATQMAVMRQTGLDSQVDSVARAIDMQIAARTPQDQLARSYLPTPSEVPREIINKNTHVLTQDEMNSLGIDTSYLTNAQLSTMEQNPEYIVSIGENGTAIYQSGSSEPIAQIDGINQQSISNAVATTEASNNIAQSQSNATTQATDGNESTNDNSTKIIDTPPAKIEKSDIPIDAKQDITADPSYFDKTTSGSTQNQTQVGTSYFDNAANNAKQDIVADPSYFDKTANNTEQDVVADPSYFDSQQAGAGQHATDVAYFEQSSFNSSAPANDSVGEDSGAGQDGGDSSESNDNGQDM
ncbi:MAG: hypothetical protein IKB27_01390 [Clostridia bacterium]|nr:hypothetical protein [Clostridia bacterium]